ncbi:MAG: SHOCT domain-containing protein [Nitrosopumilus sp.]|uniref:SHOCT domain-containing protein n=1 Tax=Nitrosopumilus sp. TaxID=2024843 RepID=UPI0029313313|nr:SHOCT domain-containing protein [Nitrosopumilus sp.]
MSSERKKGYIEKFLKKADEALLEGVKKADEVLEEAVEFGAMTAKQAAKTSKEIRTQAKKEKDAIQKKGIKKITKGISAAKSATSNSKEDLATLEKLGKLKKMGIITDREFQAKKKKILERI